MIIPLLSSSISLVADTGLTRFYCCNPRGGGALPSISYIGMCDPKGYGFSAVLVINRVSIVGRVRLGSIRNKNNWNNASKRLFGSYSHSGIPGFPFRLFYSQEQNSRNTLRNIFRNIPNERALS